METPLDNCPPPPAYSEQEFDQKISLATSISALGPSPPPVDEEGWEPYDPSAFEDTVTARSSSNHNQLCRDKPAYTSQNDGSDLNNLFSIVPLRIEKKSQIKTDRPYMDPQVGVGSFITPTTQFPTRQNAGHNASGSGSWKPTDLDKDDYNPYATHLMNGYFENPTALPDRDFQLPQHQSPSPPSPYLHVDAHPERTFSQDGPWNSQRSPYVNTNDSYHGSLLHSPTTENYEAPSSRNSLAYSESQYPVQPRTPRRALPSQPPQQTLSGQPPPATYQSPRMSFNPSVAYGKTSASPANVYHPPPSPQATPQCDPRSFYNSAVSAQMAPLRRIPSTQPQYPVYNQRQYQGQISTTSGLPNQYPDNPSPGSFSPQAIRQRPRPDSSYTVANSHMHMSTGDIDRFSQYSDISSRNSVYNNQTKSGNVWYPTR